MRTVDGVTVAFIHSEDYFASLATPSMTSTARATGAGIVLLLADGKTEADVSDDDIRRLLNPDPASLTEISIDGSDWPCPQTATPQAAEGEGNG